VNDLNADELLGPAEPDRAHIPGLTPAAPQIPDDVSNEFQQIAVFTLAEVRE